MSRMKKKQKHLLIAFACVVLISVFFFPFSPLYGVELKKDPKIQSASPPPPPPAPAKIQFKRDPKGQYSWEITGPDAGEIIRQDKRLRNYLKEIDGTGK